MKEFYAYQDDRLYVHHSLEHSPDPTQYKMHTHEFCELYYFIHGKGVFRIEGTRYPLHPGDLLIMRRAEAHRLEIEPSEPYERISIHFDPAMFDALDPTRALLRPFYEREMGRRNRFVPSDFDSSLCTALFETLMERQDDLHLQIVSSLIVLLNELRRAFARQEKSKTAVSDSTDKRVIDYINRHLSEELSLDRLCSRFYISKPQLCRIFKAATGSTVWSYITIKRLMAAQQMIRAGTAPTRAAAACGFNDYSVFYRAWRRRFGTSPKAS